MKNYRRVILSVVVPALFASATATILVSDFRIGIAVALYVLAAWLTLFCNET